MLGVPLGASPRRPLGWALPEADDRQVEAVHHVVVVGAEQHAVLDRRLAQVPVPPADVVRLAVGRRDVTAVPGAGAVTDDDRPTLRCGEQPRGAAHVERLGLGVEQDAPDLGRWIMAHGITRLAADRTVYPAAVVGLAGIVNVCRVVQCANLVPEINQRNAAG